MENTAKNKENRSRSPESEQVEKAGFSPPSAALLTRPRGNGQKTDFSRLLRMKKSV